MLPTLRIFTLLALAGTLITFDVQALEVPAGQWSMRVKISMSMNEEPYTFDEEECLSENLDLRTELLVQSGMEQYCRFTPTADTRTELAGDLVCDLDEVGSAQGSVNIVLDGQRVNGQARMNVVMSGQKQQASLKWVAQRLGACE